MLQIQLYRHSTQDKEETLLTKKIRLDDTKTILFQISAKNAYGASLLEGTIVDTVAENSKSGGAYDYFSFLLDALNRNLKGVHTSLENAGLRIFLSVLEGNSIHFSVLGDVGVYLVSDEKIIDIARGMGGGNIEFSYISSGAIKPTDSVYIANVDLLDYFSPEDLLEIARGGDSDTTRTSIERMIEREAGNTTIDCVILTNPDFTDVRSPNLEGGFVSTVIEYTKFAFAKSKQFLTPLYEKAKENETLRQTLSKVKTWNGWKNEKIRAGLFGAGALVAIILLYFTVNAVFQERSTAGVPEEYKNKLIEAQLLIEKAPKDLANRESFKANLKKAEDLIFEVREKQIWMNDVKRLLDNISVLKKQLNGIESFNPKTHESEAIWSDKEFNPIGVYEFTKKLYFVGKNKLAGPFVKGGELKTYNYPDGEEAIASDLSAEGVVYILTKSNRVLKFYKGEFTYVNVEGQKTWEEWTGIKAFNSNLYILSKDGNQIFKHKPSVNGFAAKSSMLEGTVANRTFFDFTIDGSFYAIKKDLTIDKFFTAPSFSEKSVVINGLPDGYSLTSDKNPPKLFLSPNGNYLYLILENKIWIMEPNSRNYKDVKSLKYIGQIEVTEDVLDSIFIPKDGVIYAVTKQGAYTINFEVSDSKIILR